MNFFLIANPQFPAKNVARNDRCDQAQSGQVQLCVGRQRQPASSVHGIAQDRIRPRHPARPVQRDAGGADRSLERHDTGDVRRCDRRGAEHPGGQGDRLGDVRGQAHDAAAGRAADRRDGAGFDWQAWQGIVAPAGTPREIVARLSTELQRIQATPEFREQLFKFGMEPFAPHTPEQFAATIAAEQPRWAKAIKDSGAKVD